MRTVSAQALGLVVFRQLCEASHVGCDALVKFFLSLLSEQIFMETIIEIIVPDSTTT